MKLRFDPYQIFRSSQTPAGLYARQKWLDESETQQWRQDFQKCVRMLLADQSSDGSWNDDPLATINRLFGLHLTQRSSTWQIDIALDWLLGEIKITQEGLVVRHEIQNISNIGLSGLPFVPSRKAARKGIASVDRHPKQRWNLWFRCARVGHIFMRACLEEQGNSKVRS